MRIDIASCFGFAGYVIFGLGFCKNEYLYLLVITYIYGLHFGIVQLKAPINNDLNLILDLRKLIRFDHNPKNYQCFYVSSRGNKMIFNEDLCVLIKVDHNSSLTYFLV